MRTAVFALFLSLLPLSAAAQGEPPEEPAPAAAPPPVETPPKKELPPGFQPVPGGEARAEAVDANILVVLAYATFFLAMFGYVIHVVRSQTALAKEIQELSKKLESRR
jgi:hypothetical protein